MPIRAAFRPVVNYSCDRILSSEQTPFLDYRSKQELQEPANATSTATKTFNF
jgi:hypothetical protein